MWERDIEVRDTVRERHRGERHSEREKGRDRGGGERDEERWIWRGKERE